MNLTNEQIEARMSAFESMMAKTTDTKALPGINRTYQMLLDELVNRDMELTNGQADD